VISVFTMSTTRPCVSDLTLLHYAKPIHPEFFRIVASQTVERSNYSLAVHLTGTGHVAEFRTSTLDGKQRYATEVTTSAHFEMPGSPVSSLRFKGHQHALIPISEFLQAETTFDCETLGRKAFMTMQSELVKANELDGLFYHFGPNGRIALGGLSYLTLKTWNKRVRIRAYHTFPESCRVLTTDTIISQNPRSQT
jgi:hypothetical protein